MRLSIPRIPGQEQFFRYRKGRLASIAGCVFLALTVALVGIHISHMINGSEVAPASSEATLMLGFGFLSVSLITGEGLGGIAKTIRAWKSGE